MRVLFLIIIHVYYRIYVTAYNREDHVYGVCGSVCCIGFYKENGTCKACPIGRIGTNCGKSCPNGTYGNRCMQTCYCQVMQLCDPIHGCISYEPYTKSASLSPSLSENNLPVRRIVIIGSCFLSSIVLVIICIICCQKSHRPEHNVVVRLSSNFARTILSRPNINEFVLHSGQSTEVLTDRVSNTATPDTIHREMGENEEPNSNFYTIFRAENEREYDTVYFKDYDESFRYTSLTQSRESMGNQNN